MTRPDDPDDGAVLPEQTRDDTDVGWGEPSYDRADDDENVQRLLDEKPPHYE